MQKNNSTGRLQKDIKGLLMVAKFGWLRTAELGKLLWPESKYSRQIADQFLSNWIKRKLVIVRELPERYGRFFVLAKGGVDLLAEHGIVASTSGKNIGRTESGSWIPPATWKHDLIAAGVLAELHKRGYDIYPENEIKRTGNCEAGMKIPDGLAVRNEEVIWLEVENARKTGKHAKTLAGALIRVADESIYNVIGKKANKALVAYPMNCIDERGYSLDHKTRVTNIVASLANEDIKVAWAECEMKGAGVKSIKFTKDEIKSHRAIAIAKQISWREIRENLITAGYSNFYLQIEKLPGEKKQDFFYSWLVTNENTNQRWGSDCLTLTEAKNAAARIIIALQTKAKKPKPEPEQALIEESDLPLRSGVAREVATTEPPAKPKKRFKRFF